MKSKKTSTMPSKSSELAVRKVGDIARHRSFVLYGRSGTGKTTLAATFPGPILFIDVKDEGTDSIADVKNLDVYEAADLASFEDAYWWLVKNPKKYKTVVIDTVSQLQGLVIDEVAGDKVKQGKKAGDWGTMSKQKWGEVASIMKELLINFRDLSTKGIQVVFLAQDRVFNVDDEGDAEHEVLMPEVGPALSPSVVRTLNAAVSVIGNTFIRTREVTKEVKGKKVKRQLTEYCLRIGPNPVYTTKVRKPRHVETPSVIVDPVYEDILDIIEGRG